jgi:DNA topoisomerase I
VTALDLPKKLRWSADDEPGIQRLRHGEGLEYRTSKGRRPDGVTLDRIRALAIPPAWEDVWICSDADGHIQATGRDAKGRKQYRYHAEFRLAQDQQKFDSLCDFGDALPLVRRRVEADLRHPRLTHDKVVAVVVRLLEMTAIRVGNDEYARANRSYGLTTMLDRHARFEGGNLRFIFNGKSGQRHDVLVEDRQVARVVRSCQELPGQRLFQWEDDDRNRRPVSSSDVNQYLANAATAPITAKHFRTWAGTVRAASLLASRPVPSSVKERRSVIREAIVATADALGNTPAVCRASYIHPMVIERFEQSELDSVWKAGPSRPSKWLTADERRLLHVLGVARPSEVNRN